MLNLQPAYGTGSRVSVRVDFDGETTLVLPMACNSDHALVCRTDGLQIKNMFKRLSRLRDFFETHSVETDFGYGMLVFPRKEEASTNWKL